MIHHGLVFRGALAWLVGPLLLGAATAAPSDAAKTASGMQKRWLFVWRDMSDPREVDRVIARFPQAQADGYNGVALSYNVPREKAAALRQAAEQHGLDLVAIVMGGSHDRNYMEGVLAQDALFVAQAGQATLRQDNPTQLLNGDFEDVTGN